MWGLGPSDFQKVRDGYACANCLEEWGFYQPRCDVCGKPTGMDYAEPPRHWLPSPQDKAGTPPTDNPGIEPLKNFDEAVKAFGEKPKVSIRDLD